MTQEALRLQLDSQIHIGFLLIGRPRFLGKKEKKNENVGFCGEAKREIPQRNPRSKDEHKKKKKHNRHVSPDPGIEPEP